MIAFFASVGLIAPSPRRRQQCGSSCAARVHRRFGFGE